MALYLFGIILDMIIFMHIMLILRQIVRSLQIIRAVEPFTERLLNSLSLLIHVLVLDTDGLQVVWLGLNCVKLKIEYNNKNRACYL